jgi:hypothetical protein
MARRVDATIAVDVSQAVSHFLPCPLQIPHEGHSQVGTAGHVKAPSSAATPGFMGQQHMDSWGSNIDSQRTYIWIHRAATYGIHGAATYTYDVYHMHLASCPNTYDVCAGRSEWQLQPPPFIHHVHTTTPYIWYHIYGTIYMVKPTLIYGTSCASQWTLGPSS